MEQFLYYALAALIGELWMWFWDRRTIKKLQEEIIKLKKDDRRTKTNTTSTP